MDANKVVVLADGKVAEQGAPDVFLKKDGAFARMVELQTEGQSWVIV